MRLVIGLFFDLDEFKKRIDDLHRTQTDAAAGGRLLVWRNVSYKPPADPTATATPTAVPRLAAAAATAEAAQRESAGAADGGGESKEAVGGADAGDPKTGGDGDGGEGGADSGPWQYHAYKQQVGCRRLSSAP